MRAFVGLGDAHKDSILFNYSCFLLQYNPDINIGASFHVASCIKFDAFLDTKWIDKKRTKTMKFNIDSSGIAQFL